VGVGVKFGSLFTGIGGFDLAFERAGMECAWQCEIDRSCQKLLKERFGKPVYDDVRTITRDSAEPVELICGGFPCQDLSIAGKRKGFTGERSGLWFEFARIIGEFKPEWVVIENVPGLLSSNRGADFAVLLRGLVEFGYGVSWRILDAQNFGVAQRRRRVFIVGSLGSGRSAEVLFEPEGLFRDTPKGRKTGEGVAGTLDAKSASSNRGSQANETEFITYNISAFNSNSMLSDNPNSGIQEIDTVRTLDNNGGNPACNQGGAMITKASTFTIRSGKEGGGKGFLSSTELGMTLGGQPQYLDITNTIRSGGDGGVPSSRGENLVIAYENHPNDSRITETGEISQQLTSRMETGGGNVPLVQCMESGQPNAGIGIECSPTLNSSHENPIVWDALQETSVAHKTKPQSDKSYTLNGAGKMMVGVRRLTPTECERLQGFPDGWTDGQSDTVRYKQLGNAVAVPVAEWIGRRVLTSTHDPL
jgi:DNA (cytosine-5)-methyltransferase 1